MRDRKSAPEGYRTVRAAALAALLISTSAALAQAGNSSSPTAKPIGAVSPSETSAVAGGQQQLYNSSGANGAQITQDSFKGSIVTGKSTGTTIDLSLDDAIQRGLRQNLGLILQTSSQKNANGQRLE